MELLSLLLIAGINTGDLELNNSYPENIEYCSSIMYNPNLEDEFYSNCSLQQVNNYMMDIKRNGY